jgi:hypothetical protein
MAILFSSCDFPRPAPWMFNSVDQSSGSLSPLCLSILKEGSGVCQKHNCLGFVFIAAIVTTCFGRAWPSSGHSVDVFPLPCQAQYRPHMNHTTQVTRNTATTPANHIFYKTSHRKKQDFTETRLSYNTARNIHHRALRGHKPRITLQIVTCHLQ